MNRVFFMAMTMCMVLCLSTGASAQTKLTPKNAPATAKKAEVKQAKVPSKTKKVDVVFDKKQFCLLYTSDAADDMQCVELGGRGIIKKQNTKHNTRAR